MKMYLKVLKQYADFNGRATRSEYWIFQLVNYLITAVFMAVLFGMLYNIGITLETNPDYVPTKTVSWTIISLAVIALVYSLAVFIPSLAVAVRRLHDIGKSGAWLFISLIPFGSFVLLIFQLTDTQDMDNHYGPNPKRIVEETTDYPNF